jgi:hydroxyacyl-ACP dehydratase HTD2-like protein with hotdog domain
MERWSGYSVNPEEVDILAHGTKGASSRSRRCYREVKEIMYRTNSMTRPRALRSSGA